MSRSESARREMLRHNPRGGVPTFVIDGRVLAGFDGRVLFHAIEAAARRRMQRR